LRLQHDLDQRKVETSGGKSDIGVAKTCWRGRESLGHTLASDSEWCGEQTERECDPEIDHVENAMDRHSHDAEGEQQQPYKGIRDECQKR
jgi:hypothetical protein